MSENRYYGLLLQIGYYRRMLAGLNDEVTKHPQHRSPRIKAQVAALFESTKELERLIVGKAMEDFPELLLPNAVLRPGD